MDTSETYILMCEKAEEIQRSRPPIVPVTLYRFKNGDIVDFRGDYIAQVQSDDCVLRYKYIYLPRQDQLQEMANLKVSAGWLFLNSFIRNYIETIDESCDFPNWDSWEQLWLAFVMKEKFGKVWNGLDWVS